MSVSTSDILEEASSASTMVTSMVHEDPAPSSNILERHVGSTSSLLDLSLTADFLEQNFASEQTLPEPSRHHSSSSYCSSRSSRSTSSGMTGSPPNPSGAPALMSSSSPAFPVFVHTEGVLDGMVALPGDEVDVEKELEEYYEQVLKWYLNHELTGDQGKISGVQLENYKRRNSETREPFREEDQSPSSTSRLI